jgi:hypothetical protein
MTPVRFWFWLVFCVGGWSLSIFGPRDLRWLGFLMAIGIAPGFAIARNQFGQKVGKWEVGVLAGLLVILVVAIAMPLWFHNSWSVDSPAARFVGTTVVALIVGGNAWRTFRRVDRDAA